MPPPPLLGYNNNVRHRGRIFHIQTEDSGLQNPRIMTHLFADGGRIVKSRRTDYSEHIGRDDQVEVVRGLMKEQHKAMFVALRCGEFDALIGFDAEAPPPSLSSQGVRQQAEDLTPASNVQNAGNVQGAPTGVTKGNVPTGGVIQGGVAKDAEQSGASALGAAGSDSAFSAAAAHVAIAGPTAAATSRGASGDKNAPTVAATSDVRRPNGSEQAAPSLGADASQEAATATELAAPAPTARRASRRPPKAAEPARVESARPDTGRPYAAPRPASIFAEAPQAGESLFGEAAMDEKSLDSAILSYLSEDDDEE
jgi:hypothetical protein